MSAVKKILLASAVALTSFIGGQSASAQIVVVGPPVFGPRVLPPRVVARPVVAAPVLLPPVAPVVHYRPATPVIVTHYSTYRPVLTPVVLPPAVVAPPVRAAYYGASAYGTSRAYVPGQPVRNRIRFFRP